MGRSIWLLLGLLALALTHAGCLPMAVAVPLAAAQTAGMVMWHTQDDSSEEVAAPKEKPSNKKSRYAAARPSTQKPTAKRMPVRHDNETPPLPSGSSEEVAGQIF